MSPRRSPTAATSPLRRAAVLAGVAGVLVAGAACDPSGEDESTTGCATTVAEAAEAVEPAEQVRLLDRALVVCRSVSALTTEMERYPGIVGYEVATFVELRCNRIDDDAVRTAPTCSSVIAPTTTVPPTTIVELVFVGATLDGRTIELRPGPDVPFVGEVPAVIQQTVDIASEADCDAVVAQRDEWAAQIDDPVTGDIASVYAQHAQNVLDYIGCGVDPPDAG